MLENDTQDLEQEGQDTGDTGEAVDWEARAKELEGRLKRAETKIEKVKATRPTTPQALPDDRLDKIELRQLDPSLTPEQITEVLLIKQAKGYSDASQALGDPLVKAFLSSVRSETQKEEAINRAMPKPSTKVASVPPSKPGFQKTGADWVNNAPNGIPVTKLADILSEGYGLNE